MDIYNLKPIKSLALEPNDKTVNQGQITINANIGG